MDPKYMNTDDAAAYLRVSTATLRTWVKSKKLPETCYFKLGGTYRFHADRLEEYLQGDLDKKTAPAPEEEDKQLEFEFIPASEAPPVPTDDEPQVTNHDVDEDY